MDCCSLQWWRLRGGTGCWGQTRTNDLEFMSNHRTFNWITQNQFCLYHKSATRPAKGVRTQYSIFLFTAAGGMIYLWIHACLCLKRQSDGFGKKAVMIPWRRESVSPKIKRHHHTNPDRWRQTPAVNPRVAGPVVTSWTVSSVLESWSKSDCCLLSAPRQKTPASKWKTQAYNVLIYIYTSILWTNCITVSMFLPCHFALTKIQLWD